MSIPLTASKEAFTPQCLSEIDGAPEFTFRHATVLDKNEFQTLAIREGLVHHSSEKIRETIVSELRRLFDSPDGIEQRITKLLEYWQAKDELNEAMAQHQSMVAKALADAVDGEKPDLPPEPTIEFPEDQIEPINDMIDEVRRYSTRVNGMMADNHAFANGYPRLLLRMFLLETTLDVPIQRRLGLVTAESAETILVTLGEVAEANGVDAEMAMADLLLKATLSFALGKDEEKNSSSPRSELSSPKSSAKQSASKGTKSSDPVNTDSGHGSSSSD